MARAGAAAREVLDEALRACKPGATTASIDALVREGCADRSAQPLFLGYSQGKSPPFPGAVCISVNEEVVHGVPGHRVLRSGDIVSIDVGIRLGAWCADTASTIAIVECDASSGLQAPKPPSPQASAAARMIAQNRALLDRAIGQMRPGARWSAIARDLEREAERSGFGIITEYIGHGIGRDLHEGPKAPAYWSGFAGDDFTLEAGMVLAIEPMLALRRGVATAGDLPRWRMPVRLLPDGWTVVTLDASPACHEEHMVAILESGPLVLTTMGAASGIGVRYAAQI